MSVVRPFAAPKPRERPFTSFGEQMQALIRHENQQEFDSRLVRAPTGAGEVDAIGGGFLLQTDFAADLVESLYSAAVIAPLCDRRQVEKPEEYVLPAIDERSRADGSRSGGVLAYWLAESAVIPETFPKFRRVVFKPKN